MFIIECFLNKETLSKVRTFSDFIEFKDFTQERRFQFSHSHQVNEIAKISNIGNLWCELLYPTHYFLFSFSTNPEVTFIIIYFLFTKLFLVLL